MYAYLLGILLGLLLASPSFAQDGDGDRVTTRAHTDGTTVTTYALCHDRAAGTTECNDGVNGPNDRADYFDLQTDTRHSAYAAFAIELVEAASCQSADTIVNVLSSSIAPDATPAPVQTVEAALGLDAGSVTLVRVALPPPRFFEVSVNDDASCAPWSVWLHLYEHR